jgi:DNA-3-methyladenine glycosylase
MHWLLNIVADQVDVPAAVLIRAIFPLAGAEAMALNRPHLAYSSQWLNGPAKLTQAFGIDGSLNGHDLQEKGSELYLAEALVVPQDKIKASPRVGLGNTPEPWLSLPWRWEVSWQDVKELIAEQKKE